MKKVRNLKKRYALVGTGIRGTSMFLEPLVKEYGDVAEVVSVCDLNPKRARFALEKAGIQASVYTDFDQMLAAVDFDVVIIASPDYSHHDYIIKAMRAGKEVISEKPMTIDAEKCRAIFQAEKETGKNVCVTFNLRFVPYLGKIKELLASGIVGDIYAVDFKWYLDTWHGVDYFRRWHAHMANSGSLLIHKSTHHLDLVNWFISQEPKQVYAEADLNFFGKDKQPHGERCKTCEHEAKCPYYLDLESEEILKELYLDHEDIDGYHRDKCVFSSEIDIYDTMSLLVRYDQGAILNYSLIACAPFEGWEMAISGSKGRLECGIDQRFFTEETFSHSERIKTAKSVDFKKAAFGDYNELKEDIIRFYPLYGGAEAIVVPRDTSDHGGGDRRLRDYLFNGYSEDPLGKMAGSKAGAMSLLIGAAANESIKTGKPIKIKDLLAD